jgi:hypothetical protein
MMDWFQHIYENNYVTIVAADASSNEGSLKKKVYQLKQELEPTFFSHCCLWTTELVRL